MNRVSNDEEKKVRMTTSSKLYVFNMNETDTTNSLNANGDKFLVNPSRDESCSASRPSEEDRIARDMFGKEQEKMNYLNLINYICYLREPWRIIKHCDDASVCLEQLNDINLRNANCFDMYLSEERKTSLIEAILDYLKYMYDFLKENLISLNRLLKKRTSNEKKPTNSDSDDEYMRLYMLYRFTLVIWSYVDTSNDFCFKFYKLRGLKCLFKYLNDLAILEYLDKQYTSASTNSGTILSVDKLVTVVNFDRTFKTMVNVYKNLLGIVHNLSKLKFLFKTQWIELRSIEVLIKLDQFSLMSLADLRLILYLAIINLLYNDENAYAATSTCDNEQFAHFSLKNLTNLINISEFIKDTCFLISLAGTQLNDPQLLIKNRPMQRKQFLLDTVESGSMSTSSSSYATNANVCEILVICHKNTTWRLTELLKCLAIAIEQVDDKLKRSIYIDDKHGLRTNLRLIIFNGNELEKEFALRLLCQFAKLKQLAAEIQLDDSLYSFILGLSINNNIKSKNLVKNANLILFLINNFNMTSSSSSSGRQMDTLDTRLTNSMSSEPTSRFRSSLNYMKREVVETKLSENDEDEYYEEYVEDFNHNLTKI